MFLWWSSFFSTVVIYGVVLFPDLACQYNACWKELYSPTFEYRLFLHVVYTGSGEMLRAASVSINSSGMRRRFSTWRKNSLISKIHLTDTNSQPEHTHNVVSVSSVKGELGPTIPTHLVPTLLLHIEFVDRLICFYLLCLSCFKLCYCCADCSTLYNIQVPVHGTQCAHNSTISCVLLCLICFFLFWIFILPLLPEPITAAASDRSAIDAASVVPKLTRNATGKGSRYGNKIPPKRISALDGAKFVSHKFGGQSQVPLITGGSLASKQHYGKCVTVAGVLVHDFKALHANPRLQLHTQWGLISL